MDAKIEIEGTWYDCIFCYPNQEAPMLVRDPRGVEIYMESPFKRFNAKLIMRMEGPSVPNGAYNVRHQGKALVFEAQKSTVATVWGNVSMKLRLVSSRS